VAFCCAPYIQPKVRPDVYLWGNFECFIEMSEDAIQNSIGRTEQKTAINLDHDYAIMSHKETFVYLTLINANR